MSKSGETFFKRELGGILSRTITRASRQRDRAEYGYKFEYHESGNFYYVAANRKLINEVITEDMEHFTHYLTKQHEKYFPEYDPEIHTIDLVTMYGAEIYPKLQNLVFRIYESSKNHECSLPFGIYQLSVHQDYGLIFKKHGMTNVDEYIDLGRSVGDLKENFLKFRKIRKKIEECPVRIRHKQGTLLYGPPGTGKTREIIRLFELEQEEMDFYTLIVPKDVPIRELNSIRELFSTKDSDIVFVFEEITERNKFGTDELLTFLDGEFSWEHAYVIATTNFVKEMEANLNDRPGRFEKTIYMGPPDKKQIRIFMGAFGVEEENIEKVIKKYYDKDLSLDYYRYIAIQQVIWERSLSDIFEELERTRQHIGGSLKGRMGLGL